LTWALESSASNLYSIDSQIWDERPYIVNKALRFFQFLLLTYVYYYDNMREGMYLGPERKRHAGRRWRWAEKYRRPNTIHATRPFRPSDSTHPERF
jgi:hypothetical protein